MKTLTRFGMVLVLGMTLLAACGGDDDDGPVGDGGNTVTGTCASTCTKSIALGCPNGEHDQTACVASCNRQQSSCNSKGMTTQFQTYLDCIQSTPMTCGTTSGSPTSAQCVSQGLAVVQCSLAGD